MRNRIWSKLLVCIVALTIGGCSQSAGLFRVHTYLIPAKLKLGWISIEYENPQCPKLEEGRWGREVVVPESGFLCTSSSLYTGWHRTEFYAVDENGARTSIREDEIHRKGTVSIIRSSMEPGAVPICDVKNLQEFFYGPNEKLTYGNAITKNESFLRYHPECAESVKPHP